MREVKELKRGQDQVRKELVEVKALLTKITSPTMPQINVKDVEIDLGDNAVLGDDGAKLVLVEISDYECPFCGRYVRETFPRLFEEYVSKGSFVMPCFRCRFRATLWPARLLRPLIVQMNRASTGTCIS